MTDTKDDGGPACPAPDLGERDFNDRGAYPGRSLRDYFAAHALTGWIASIPSDVPVNDDGVCARAYKIADAMLKARKS